MRDQVAREVQDARDVLPLWKLEAFIWFFLTQFKCESNSFVSILDERLAPFVITSEMGSLLVRFI